MEISEDETNKGDSEIKKKIDKNIAPKVYLIGKYINLHYENNYNILGLFTILVIL